MLFGNLSHKIGLSLCATFMLASCNQQEFYEKKFLEGAAVERPSDDTVTLPDDGGNTGGETDNGGNTGGETDNGGNTGGETDNGGNTGGETDNGGNTGGETDNGGNTGGETDNGGNTGGETDNGGNTGGETEEPTEPTEPTEPEVPVVTYETLTDTFTQNVSQKAKVDILWVIDDSGSMKDEQDSLAYNFTTFINDFLKEEVDFKMAITTTDARSYKSGNWVCSDKELTQAAALYDQVQFIQDFQDCIRVGTSGSGYEKGMQTSESFLNRHDFLREDAYLVMVMVSDEEDQSAKSVDEYLSVFRSKKRAQSLVKVNAIVNTSSSSRYFGGRYIDLATKTGGMHAEIKDNFHTILKDMGGEIVNLLDQFALTKVPETELVKVYVDGVLVESGYQVDLASGTVKFLEGSVPAEGSEIKIEYQIVKKDK